MASGVEWKHFFGSSKGDHQNTSAQLFKMTDIGAYLKLSKPGHPALENWISILQSQDVYSTNDIEQFGEVEWNALASGLSVVLRSALSPLLPWSCPRLASLPLFDESKSAAFFASTRTPDVKIAELAVQTGLPPTQATPEQSTPTGQWSHITLLLKLMLAMSVHVR